MFTAPFITPESLSLRRALDNARENAIRLYALSNAKWPVDWDFSFVEEEAREAFVLLSINFRRAQEICGLNGGDCPKIEAFSSEQPGVPQQMTLRRIFNVGAHLQRFKFSVGGSDSHEIVDLSAGSDERTIFLDPATLVHATLSSLAQMSADEFEIETARKANSRIGTK